MTRARAALAAVLVALLPAGAGAQDEPPEAPPPDTVPPGVAPPAPVPATPAGPRVPVVGIVGTSLEGAVLVGHRGELYARQPDATWRRKQGGGVAITLTAATGRTPDAILAIGTGPPVFRHDGRTWLTDALPVTSGAAILTRGGGPPVVLVGRRAVLRDGARWKPVRARTGDPCQALASAGDDLVALCGGKVEHYDGRSWAAVPSSVGTIVAVAGGARTYALGAQGGVLAFAGRRPSRIRPPATAVAALVVTETAPGKVAVLARDAAGLRLYVDEASALVPREVLPATDAPVLFAALGDSLIVVTESGQVLVRSAAGQWTVERIDPTLAPPPASPTLRNPPARAG